MRKKTDKQEKTDLIAGLFALVLIVVIWFLGSLQAEQDLLPLISDAAGDSTSISNIDNGIWLAEYDDDAGEFLIIGTGTGEGYGGDLKAFTLSGPDGKIKRIVIYNHRETETFLKKVMRKNLLSQFTGKRVNSVFRPGEDINVISGATLTSNAIAEAVRSSSHNISNTYFKLDLPPYPEIKLHPGLKEYSWFFLLAIAYITSSLRVKRQRELRWAVMLVSIVFLGFWLNAQLSISQVNKVILGYWPDWHMQLYLYIMLIGILALILFTGKNHYCDRVCPFGTSQDILGRITGAKTRNFGKFRRPLIWLQRLLALGVIITALITRKPGTANYEVFGTMFRLTGNSLQFGLLFLTAILSLFIKRPWCGYLCPVRPVNDYVRAYRNYLAGILKNS